MRIPSASALALVLFHFLAAATASAQTMGDDAIAARVPAQRVSDPFAIFAVGVEVGRLFPLASTWPLASADGSFARITPRPLDQAALSIGALHFFGHADLWVSIPILSRGAPIGAGAEARRARATYLVGTGVKYYPWALRPGTLRPFVSTGLLVRTFGVEAAPAANVATGKDERLLWPVGVGLGWRTPWGIVADLQCEYSLGDRATIDAATDLRPLDQTTGVPATAGLDLRGLRVVLGIRGVVDLSREAVRPGFREGEIASLRRRIADGTANAWNLAAGPSTKLISNGSSYFDRRPFFGRGLNHGVFLHASAGFYHFGLDAELRAAYRGMAGKAEAFGGMLKNGDTTVFLEALKFFDLGFYGFVPFVGLGVGHAWLDFAETVPSERLALSARRVVASVPFGWDIRIRPSGWWLLRTNLRWVPRAEIDVAAGVPYDLGGLEFDFIQLVVFPERLFGRAGS